MKNVFSSFALVIGFTVIAAICIGAGTISGTDTDTGIGSVKLRTLSWSNGTNTSATATIGALNGTIERVSIVPDTNTVALYDITITDADSNDILAGLGGNLASNTTVHICPGIDVQGSTQTNATKISTAGAHTVTVQNTGAGGSTGTIKIYYKP